ncbi:hypothetical protein BJ742DRAFT_792237 [Cladochytrium replicatum]|nr:hypothetical protein BJ742DRAFT_792237 [Cladochytrium replicatum]
MSPTGSSIESPHGSSTPLLSESPHRDSNVLDYPAHTTSKTIASILGPALIVIGATESLNLQHFENLPPAHVYQNGIIIFTGGLVILRFHFSWRWSWTTLITVMGSLMTAVGTLRMAFPATPAAVGGAAFYGTLATLVLTGSFLTWKGYH